jgi:hypothetical protein
LPPASRLSFSEEDIFNDVTFPQEFVLKSEIGRNRGRSGGVSAPSPSIEKRGVKRQSSSAMRASSLKIHRSPGRFSNGRFLFLSLVVLLILLSLWSRLSMW